MYSIVKKIVRGILPYYLISKRDNKRKKQYVEEYFSCKSDGNFVNFDERPNYEKIISIQGFGYSGSGAVVDLFREYSECNVIGYVDEEGSLSNKAISTGELDFLRHTGGIFDIEKHIGDNNVFINDGILHHFLQLVSCTPVCNQNEQMKAIFYSFFDKIVDFSNQGLTQRYYNGHILESGTSNIFYLKAMPLEEYEEIASRFIMTVLNRLNYNKRPSVVLDQFFCDFNCDIRHYKRYVKDAKCIMVYRDPRDIYTFAVIHNVEWIPHNSVDDFIKWTKIQFAKFDLESSDYLAIKFEALVLNYEEECKRIESFVNFDSQQHIHIKQHFDPAVSKENVELWKKYNDKYSCDYRKIEEELNCYCYKG